MLIGFTCNQSVVNMEYVNDLPQLYHIYLSHEENCIYLYLLKVITNINT